jgi:predicted RNA-binding protein YlxR (DUF448 family)
MPARPKRIPVRTCVACRSAEAKRGLVRIVRTPQGRVEIDPTGKKSGRGAYLHANRDCWELALKKDLLSRALKISVPADDRETLRQYAERLEATPANT